MALGFALPFAAGGYWHTMRDSSLRLEWWKNWEMTIGLFGGLGFGTAFWLFNRPAGDPAAPPGRLARRFFRSGLHLSVPSFVVLSGAYEGWCRLQEIEPARAGHLALFVLSVCLPFAIRLWRGDVGPDAQAGCGASLRTAAALLGMIVAAGFLVSVPAEWHLANVVLITLYALYVGAGMLLTSRLWRRERP